MNSPFAKMYIEIIERILAKVPEVRYINQDIGQLENYGDRPPVSFPCVLIDLENFAFSNMAENCQIAEGMVQIRLALSPFSNASSLSPDGVKEKALTFYEIEQKLYSALHGWQGIDFGALIRESAETEKRDDGLRVRAINFSTTFQDNSAQHVYDVVDPNLNIDNNTGFVPAFRWTWSMITLGETRLQIIPAVGSHIITQMDIYIRSKADSCAMVQEFNDVLIGPNITEAIYLNLNQVHGGPLCDPPTYMNGYQWILQVKMKTSTGITGVCWGQIWQDPDGNYTAEGLTDLMDVILAQDSQIPVYRVGNSTLVNPN